MESNWEQQHTELSVCAENTVDSREAKETSLTHPVALGDCFHSIAGLMNCVIALLTVEHLVGVLAFTITANSTKGFKSQQNKTTTTTTTTTAAAAIIIRTEEKEKEKNINKQTINENNQGKEKKRPKVSTFPSCLLSSILLCSIA
jgi:hypothetical protein